MTHRKYFYFISASIILLIGGFIYICFRDENILLFSWLRYFNINYSFFRQINLVNNFIIEYIIYNLPNGLWVLSGLCIMSDYCSGIGIRGRLK